MCLPNKSWSVFKRGSFLLNYLKLKKENFKIPFKLIRTGDFYISPSSDTNGDNNRNSKEFSSQTYVKYKKYFMIACDDKLYQLWKNGYDNPITFLPLYFLRSTKHNIVSNPCENKIRKGFRHLAFKMVFCINLKSKFPKHKSVKHNKFAF